MGQNPFGNDPNTPRRVNPFGVEDDQASPAEAANRIDASARKIRTLRSQIGAEGLTLPATRELIDQVAAALESAAAALRALSK